jgi:hypothetical protein
MAYKSAWLHIIRTIRTPLSLVPPPWPTIATTKTPSPPGEPNNTSLSLLPLHCINHSLLVSHFFTHSVLSTHLSIKGMVVTTTVHMPIAQTSTFRFTHSSFFLTSLFSTVFDYVWSKVRTLVGGTSVDKSEAHHWWKRVYGGLVSLSCSIPYKHLYRFTQ